MPAPTMTMGPWLGLWLGLAPEPEPPDAALSFGTGAPRDQAAWS